MSHIYRKAMDALYLACVFIAGVALVVISAVIPWAVYTRYVINRAASWPEPTAVLLTIVLTFFGAAACYRLGLHMNVTLAMVMTLIACASAFGYVMALMQLPAKITAFFLTLSNNRDVILMLINIMLLVLGCLMDLAPLLLICTPILLPVVTTFGVDPVHFGMIMLLNLGIGLLTPPVGATLFVGCAVGKVTMEEVMRGIWPFYAVMFAVLMLVTYIPAISLWLPRLLGL
jgi:tripartite ATP-independent transporter DctM subunit